MNLVESFFSIITRQTIRRASFTSVRQVTDAIRLFIDGWNHRCVPFVWTKTADEILAVTNRKAASENGPLVRGNRLVHQPGERQHTGYTLPYPSCTTKAGAGA